MSDDTPTGFIVIKKGSIETKLARADFIGVDETHDGICFNFQKGVHLYYTDGFLPGPIKKIIAATADNVNRGTLFIDLDNYRQPTRVEL